MSVIDTGLEALKKAPLDNWLALSEDESSIVAVGSSYSEVVSKSEELGISDPVILKTPKVWLPIAV
jgi:hypothetical protein